MLLHLRRHSHVRPSIMAAYNLDVMTRLVGIAVVNCYEASCGRLREAISKDNVAVRLLRFFHYNHHNTHPSFLSIPKTNTSTFIKMQNEHGQGVSHATDSKVPSKIQEQAPSKLEHELPDVSPLFHSGRL